ncbi:MAG: glutathione S-transferase family protein [Rhizobiaceae bacterium]
MADELVFYTNPMSRGRVARWMLEEIGQPYRTEYLEYGSTESGGMKAPDYLAINPMGKVPTIVHITDRGEQVVTEVDAICTYLADAFPETGLAPLPAERGAYYRWIFFTAGPFEAAIINRALEVDVPDEKKGFVGYGNYADVMDTVEAAVDHDGYIAGDTFTAADVCLGSQIGFGMQFGGVEKRPAFERCWERVSDRDAKLRADEIDNAAMPKEG